MIERSSLSLSLFQSLYISNISGIVQFWNVLFSASSLSLILGFGLIQCHVSVCACVAAPFQAGASSVDQVAGSAKSQQSLLFRVSDAKEHVF